MNSKNNNAKKDLCLAYSQGNKSAYPLSAKLIARYMSAQYPNKNPGYQPDSTTGDRNRKKGNDPKSEDKDNNTTCTIGSHIGDVTTPEDSTTPGDGSSISAHVSEATKQPSHSTRSVENLLEAHSIDDAIWSGNNSCDVLVDTANNKEVMADSHIPK